MEDITTQLNDDLNVDDIANSTMRAHPFQSSRFRVDCKERNIRESQANRRQKRLIEQKSRRYEVLDQIRKSKQFSFSTKSPKKSRVEYGKQLMFSEWMVDVPDDLKSYWMMVPCPIGRRNIVVASKGKTHAFAKGGHLISTFNSRLPGGFYSSESSSKDSTIIDCIFHVESRTYYILDVLQWRTQPVVDSEREFRSFWLKSKYCESPELFNVSPANEFSFKLLTEINADKESLNNLMSQKGVFDYELDGLLFFHRQGLYQRGVNPLCLWLKCYMLYELLAVTVHKCYLTNIPNSYDNFRKHASRVREKKSLSNTMEF